MAKEIKEVLVEGTDSTCKCGKCESTEFVEGSSIVCGKVMVAKLATLDKIIKGLEEGANAEHCLTLSTIYKNLCN